MSIELISREWIEVDYNAWYVRFIIDGCPSESQVPKAEGETDQDALAYLNARYDSLLSTAQDQYSITHGIPKEHLDKIEHPNFTVGWNPVSEKTEITDKTGTVAPSDVETRLATLEAAIDVLGEKR